MSERTSKRVLPHPLLVGTILILPFLARLTYEMRKVEKPPSDFGSGSMFDKIAHRYDMINRVLALNMDLEWRKEMVQVVKDKTADVAQPRLLDIATGTADVAILMAQAMDSATVLGLDPSPNMLDVGRTKISTQNLDSRVILEVADSRNLEDYPAEYYDGATMSFGIRNVPERDQALCQIHRLLKPGAVFCILEFSEPDDSFGKLGAFARFFIRRVVPVLGGILSGKPREYLHLQNSIKDFPTPPEFAKLIETVNCQAVGDSEAVNAGGFFHVEELRQLNFGSVQLYIITKQVASQTETMQEESGDDASGAEETVSNDEKDL